MKAVRLIFQEAKNTDQRIRDQHPKDLQVVGTADGLFIIQESCTNDKERNSHKKKPPEARLDKHEIQERGRTPGWRNRCDWFGCVKHGDVVGGVVIGSAADIANVKGNGVTKISGSTCSPFNAFLVLRGLQTLDLRVRRHCGNALKVAQYLETVPYVKQVNFPGLESSPYHAQKE